MSILTQRASRAGVPKMRSPLLRPTQAAAGMDPAECLCTILPLISPVAIHIDCSLRLRTCMIPSTAKAKVCEFVEALLSGARGALWTELARTRGLARHHMDWDFGSGVVAVLLGV